MKIKKEFKELIPRLTADEFSSLETNCLLHGIRESILVWDDTIIDGHNRYEIAQKHDLPFTIKTIDFENEEQAKIFIIDLQLSRRNITEFVKIELAQTKKQILLEIGKEKQTEAGKLYGEKHSQELLSIIDKTSGHNTQKEIAKDLNISTGKLAQAEIIIKKAPEEIKDKVRTGEISINQAYKEIKKEERQKDIEKQIEEIKSKPIEINGLYDLIVIDPPWNYGREYDPENSRVANPYPEMDIEQLSEIKIPCENNCIMWLWTTQAFIWDAKELLKIWGFDYKAILVWDKQKMGMGAWLRMQTEFCLLGIKGKPFWNVKDVRDIISEPRREHSRKPEGFYKMIEDNFIGKKLDYFSRQQREGWDTYGNETNKF